MKRVFRIGGGLFIYSIIPILSWITLSFVLKDSRIINVFSIIYPIQFLWSILRLMFASGANIRKEREKDPNAVWNGIFWGTIFAAIIFAIPLVFVDKFILFMGQDPAVYRIYVIYAIALLFLQVLFSLIIEKLYFEDREKTANIHLVAFNLITFVSIVLLSWLIPNKLIAVLVTLGILLIYIICLYVWQFKKFKIDFKFYRNFRYESANIISSLAMLIIYLFGFKIAFSAGPEFLAGISIVALCTDSQWDSLGAIATIAKIDISKGRYDFRKEVKNAYAYLSVAVTTSVAMTIGLFFANQVDPRIVFSILAFQVADMLVYPYRQILSAFTQIEYSATLNTIINLSFEGIRTVLSVFLLTPYCTQIGQIVQGVFTCVVFTIIRIVKYRIVDKKLVVMKKEKKEDLIF